MFKLIFSQNIRLLLKIRVNNFLQSKIFHNSQKFPQILSVRLRLFLAKPLRHWQDNSSCRVKVSYWYGHRFKSPSSKSSFIMMQPVPSTNFQKKKFSHSRYSHPCWQTILHHCFVQLCPSAHPSPLCCLSWSSRVFCCPLLCAVSGVYSVVQGIPNSVRYTH